MDVKGILRQSGAELLPQELDMLTAELDTGEYAPDYVSSCKTLIQQIQNWHHKEPEPDHAAQAHADNVRVAPDALVPKSAGSGIPTPPPIPPEKIVLCDLQRMRAEKDYKTAFRKYVKTSSIIDEAFIISHFALFKEWEISAMLTCIMFSEEYLESYFGVLDHKLIAQHQLFSESFFMRHYAELDAETVLSKGVNPWREKTGRSKQLEVFLRIKGVKL